MNRLEHAARCHRTVHNLWTSFTNECPAWIESSSLPLLVFNKLLHWINLTSDNKFLWFNRAFHFDSFSTLTIWRIHEFSETILMKILFITRQLITFSTIQRTFDFMSHICLSTPNNRVMIRESRVNSARLFGRGCENYLLQNDRIKLIDRRL